MAVVVVNVPSVPGSVGYIDADSGVISDGGVLDPVGIVGSTVVVLTMIVELMESVDMHASVPEGQEISRDDPQSEPGVSKTAL